MLCLHLFFINICIKYAYFFLENLCLHKSVLIAEIAAGVEVGVAVRTVGSVAEAGEVTEEAGAAEEVVLGVEVEGVTPVPTCVNLNGI